MRSESSFNDKTKNLTSLLTTFRSRNEKLLGDTHQQFEETIHQHQPTNDTNQPHHLWELLESDTFCHRAASVVTLWSGNHHCLRSIWKGVTGPESKEAGESEGHGIGVIRGLLGDCFIMQRVMEQNMEGETGILMEYTISSMVVLILREHDIQTQQRVLAIMETIRDRIYLSQPLLNHKPNLVICKITGEVPSPQQQWRGFESSLNAWRCFQGHIEVIDVPFGTLSKRASIVNPRGHSIWSTTNINQAEANDREVRLLSSRQQAPRCCRQLSALIRKSNKPNNILGKVVTGGLLAGISRGLWDELETNSYANVLNIIKEIIRESKTQIQQEYRDKLSISLLQRIQGGPLSRFGLYRIIEQTHHEAQNSFNQSEIAIQPLYLRSVEGQLLGSVRSEVERQRVSFNQGMLGQFHETYLCLRPLCLSKCKRMLTQLQSSYVSDGKCDDLVSFLGYLVTGYGDELAWGDELRGLKVKEQKVDQLIVSTNSNIRLTRIKQQRLHNNQHVREMEYNKKAEIARNIKNAFSNISNSRQNNHLQALMTQKVATQEQRIEELQKNFRSLNGFEELFEEVSQKEHQLEVKDKRIAELQKQLSAMREKEERERQREQEEAIKRESVESNKVVASIEPPKRVESEGRKMKRGCSCFGF